MKTLILCAALAFGSLAFGQKLPDNLPQLKAAAAKKHLRWRVQCSPVIFADDPDSNFLAYAEPQDRSMQWTVTARTQYGAIQALINALDGPPTVVRNLAKGKAFHKQCPPPLEGGPN